MKYRLSDCLLKEGRITFSAKSNTMCRTPLESSFLLKFVVLLLNLNSFLAPVLGSINEFSMCNRSESSTVERHDFKL